MSDNDLAEENELLDTYGEWPVQQLDCELKISMYHA